MGRGGLIAWSGLILLYALFAVWLYPTVHKSITDIIVYYNTLPEALKAMVGIEGVDLNAIDFSLELYVTIEFVSMLPAILSFYAIFSGVGIAREAERGTLELLLAQPVRRFQVLLNRLGTFLAGMLVISGASLLGLFFGGLIVDEPINMTQMSLVLFTAFLLVVAVGSYTFFFTCLFLEPRKALLTSGVLTASAYIINFIVPVLDPAFKWLRNLSLFYYFKPEPIVRTTALDSTAIIIYALIAIISLAAALFIFQRRDISA
jgi:ABC-2 type transport system permease protein